MLKKTRLSILVAAFIAVLLAFFLATIFIIRSVLQDSETRYDSFYENVYEYQLVLTSVGEKQASAMGNLVNGIYAENTSTLRSSLEQLAEQNRSILADAEGLLQKLATNPLASLDTQKPLIEDYLLKFRQWNDIFVRLSAYISSGDKAKAESMLPTIHSQWLLVEESFLSMQDSFARMGAAEKDAASKLFGGATTGVTVAFLALMAAVLGLSYTMVRGAVRLERDTGRYKKRLELVASGTKDCCAVLHLKNEKIDYYTQGAQVLFGSHLNELSTLAGFTARIAKADLEKFGDAVARAAKGAPARVIYRYKRTEVDSVCYISTDLQPISTDSSKKLESVLLISSDITEKHLLEERSDTLSQLFENGNYMICVFKNQTQMEYINQAALAFRGLPSVESALSLNFSSFFDSPDLYAKEIPDEIKQPEPMSIMRRVPLRRHDGQIVYVEQTLFAFHDTSTNAFKYAVIGQDISERIVHEEALEAAQTHVSAVQSAKTNVFSALALRILAPMTMVTQKLKTARESDDIASIQQELADIQQQMAALSELMGNVIDMSKSQTGVLHAEKRPFVLTSTMHELVQRYRPRFADKGLDFDLRMKNVEGSFVGDESRVVQVVQNLLSNALSYTETGSVSLSIDVFSKNSDGVLVGFTVADSGPGLSDQALSALFSPKSIDATAALGLPVSRQIALALGGDLTATSVPDSGSVFCFTARLTLPENDKG